MTVRPAPVAPRALPRAALLPAALLPAALLLAALLLAAPLLAGAGAAQAHGVNLAVAFVAVDGPTVLVTLTATGADIDRAAATHVADPGTGIVQPGWLRDAAPVVAGYVGARTAVAAGGAACPPAAPPAVDDDGDAGVTVAMRFACPASGAGVGAGALVYRSTAMVDFDPAARQAVMLRVDGDYIQVALLDSGRGEAVLRPRRVAGVPVDVVGEYVRLGIEHIFLGYDHIAFLVAVLLWARRAATLVRIVTAFTLAHSLTLSLAALGVVVIPSAIVEPAIAGTIVVVAVENFVSRAVENRWMWTGALGLVHGFGFAAVLGDHGLPQAAVAWSLGAFNLGVELGQLAIVAVALPLMWAADRAMAGGDAPARKAALVYPCSALVAVLGLWWLAERTVL